MPNPIKYSTTNVSNSIRKGNMVLGTNPTFDYGPSETSGFYSGINPPTSGYTIYSVSPPSLPTIVCPSDDNSLIYWSQILGGTNITTVAGALNYLATQSNIIALNKNYPNVVTSGMVLNYDASFVASYPTTGITWYDISGNALNGTLTNGPTFSTFGNGSIICDGLDDYIISTLSGSSFPQSEGTISFWYYIPSLSGSTDFTDRGIFDGYDTSRNHFFIRNYQVPPNNLQIAAQSTDLTYKYVANFYVPNDVWHNIVFCYKTGSSSIARVYIDGVLNSDSTISSSSFVPNGQYVGFLTNATTSCKSGRYANLSLYNRVLSQSEVLQNYYQGNIVTSGLVMMLDAGNIVSYPTSGTSIYDLSSSGNTGTLTNGPTYSIYNGGSIVFDGTNDYINVPISSSINITKNITIGVWFNFNAVTESDLIETGSSGAAFWVDKGGYKSANSILWGRQSNSSWAVTTTKFNTLLNQWVFITGTYDGTTAKVYVNGTLEGSQSLSITFTNTAFKIANGLDGYFNGKIANVQVYNRPLSASEIMQNYNTYKARFNL